MNGSAHRMAFGVEVGPNLARLPHGNACQGRRKAFLVDGKVKNRK